jgi:hypothetical protein
MVEPSFVMKGRWPETFWTVIVSKDAVMGARRKTKFIFDCRHSRQEGKLRSLTKRKKSENQWSGGGLSGNQRSAASARGSGGPGRSEIRGRRVKCIEIDHIDSRFRCIYIGAALSASEIQMGFLHNSLVLLRRVGLGRVGRVRPKHLTFVQLAPGSVELVEAVKD